MGEALARQRAKAFASQQDEAYANEMKRKGLFSERPEVFHTDYPCRLVAGQSIPLGMEVLLRRSSASGGNASNRGAIGVEVILGNQVAATVQCEAGVALSEIMESDPLCQGFIAAKVISESPLDGFISVRCIEEEANGEGQ